MIDELDGEIATPTGELKRPADTRYVPVPMTVPGVGSSLDSSIATAIGYVKRFPLR